MARKLAEKSLVEELSGNMGGAWGQGKRHEGGVGELWGLWSKCLQVKYAKSCSDGRLA